jgi:hypothetical protein
MSSFENPERPDDRPVPPVALPADREIAVRAFRLGAPQVLRRDLDVTESVLFDSDLSDSESAIVGWHVDLGIYGFDGPNEG